MLCTTSCDKNYDRYCHNTNVFPRDEPEPEDTVYNKYLLLFLHCFSATMSNFLIRMFNFKLLYITLCVTVHNPFYVRWTYWACEPLSSAVKSNFSS